MDEVREAVFAGAGFALLGFLIGGVFMIYPPFYETIDHGTFVVLKIGMFLTIIGAVFFRKAAVLGISFLLWENIVLVLSWCYLVSLLYEVIEAYSMSVTIMYVVISSLACFAMLQVYVRFKVGGYEASIDVGRFKSKTFLFSPKNKVEFFLPIKKDNRVQRSIGRLLSVSTAASGGVGAVIEGTDLLAPVFVMALSTGSLILTYIWFKVMFPDLLFCLYAGIKRPLISRSK
jgi:hypothetical protein